MSGELLWVVVCLFVASFFLSLSPVFGGRLAWAWEGLGFLPSFLPTGRGIWDGGEISGAGASSGVGQARSDPGAWFRGWRGAAGAGSARGLLSGFYRFGEDFAEGLRGERRIRHLNTTAVGSIVFVYLCVRALVAFRVWVCRDSGFSGVGWVGVGRIFWSFMTLGKRKRRARSALVEVAESQVCRMVV